jgi:DNA-binding LacI/PurR family transcriptional regulator
MDPKALPITGTPATWGSARLKSTVEDVARAANVSRQTVTNTLSHPHRVRPETRERVQVEIDRLGYRPSSAARSLRAQVSGAVGIELRTLGPGYHNGLMGPLLAELSRAAGEQGAHIVTFGTASESSSIASYEHMWLTRQVDAFVLTDTERDDPRPAWLAEHGVPFVSFGRVWNDATFTRWVDVDGASGTRLAVQHCLASGYRSVAYLGWHPGLSPVMDLRHDGWLAACRQAGLPIEGLAGSCDDDLDSVTRAAGQLLDRLEHPGAVVCASDLIAVGVHHALAERGLKVGADVGLVGFDDSETARLHGLTSVQQPLGEIAEHLLQLLQDCLRHEPPPELGGQLMCPTVHQRGSTRHEPADV